MAAHCCRYYCIGGIKQPCPPGTFGATYGLHSKACSGPCRAGFTCPEASVHDDEVACGAQDYYCPAGAGVRTAVSVGYYTTEGSTHNRVSQALCGPKGYWCAEGVRKKCPAGRYGDAVGMTTAGCTAECPTRHYCPEGSPTPIQCPAGTFGAETGLTTSHCSGLCAAGFYCPQASVSPRQKECGGEDFYCPIGSMVAVAVGKG